MVNNTIITIERQYASGGREIGELLAKKLDIPFYNEKILELAALKFNVSPESVEYADEKVSNSFLHSIAMAANATHANGALPLADALFYEETEIIKNIALHGSCVIVGRCASATLGSLKHCINVFIYADEQSRMKRAVEQYGIASNKAKETLKKTDNRRRQFYNAHANTKWDDMQTYDICINSNHIGINNCIQMIALAYHTN